VSLFYLCSLAESISLLREQLVRKALAALSEIADQCGAEPARRSLSLRFLLMYTSPPAGRIRRKSGSGTSSGNRRPGRARTDGRDSSTTLGSGARSALNGICRETGYAPDVQFLKHLRLLRKDE